MSNFGGRFSAQLKYAGWDGIVVEGAVSGTDDSVWINIIDDKVTIESAKTLWGLDIYETQEEIWRRVVPAAKFGEWLALEDNYTTQKPAVLCIGPAGENKVKFACLIHDAGNGAGQGGFGAVLGSKKLKAISVIGIGSVSIADPKALMAARLWYRQFQYDVDAPRLEKFPNAMMFSPINNAPADDQFLNKRPPFEPARAQACAGCPKACRQRMASGLANESSCADSMWPDGLLALPNWGYSAHLDPRIEVEWSYGSILGERDINEHSFSFPFHVMPGAMMGAKRDPLFPADKIVEIVASKVSPYEGDPFMFDYSEGPTGIYSDHRAKEIAWHRHYTRFWIQSALFCDWVWPLFITPNTVDMLGPTPEGEPRFFNAVTGKNISFADGVEIGRKVWNIDRSIWVLQGRHRDMEVLAGYVYNVPSKGNYYLPNFENGKWTYFTQPGRVLNKARFEEWKTKFYDFEGWNNTNGWPKRNTLEQLGLKKVAETLQSKGKLV
jgi:aldehyde:ferredoxin oxidoreductase